MILLAKSISQPAFGWLWSIAYVGDIDSISERSC